MEWREPPRSEDMSGVNTFVSNDIYDNFYELYNTSNNDHDKDRIHLESFGNKSF